MYNKVFLDKMIGRKHALENTYYLLHRSLIYINYDINIYSKPLQPCNVFYFGRS